MKKFIWQLRRREVLRSAGLYVAACWILIQGADIVLPAFGAEDWMFQALIYIAIVGFPIIVTLAWFLDISDKGIALDDGSAESDFSRFGELKLDFVVIALLALALAFSLFFNFVQSPGTEYETQETAVLIAVFENRTDDEMLDELVEARLAILIETSPRVFAIEERYYGNYKLADVVLQGAIERDGQSLRISVRGLDPSENMELFENTELTQGEQDLLNVVEDLGQSILEDLNDSSAVDSTQTDNEFTRSFVAARAWAGGRDFEFRDATQDAIASYQQAIDNDPGFALAYARLALLQFRNGEQDEGKKSWGLAREHMDGFTERERLKLLGTYNLDIVGDSAVALEYFDELLRKYPAETKTRFEVARAAFEQTDFAAAMAQSERALLIYAASDPERLRMARYARTAGDLERSISESEFLLNKDPQNAAAMLQLALAHAAGGLLDEAYQGYEKIEEVDTYAALAQAGIADLDLYRGQFSGVQDVLPARIQRLAAGGQREAAALNGVLLADSKLLGEDPAGAVLAAENSLDLSGNIHTKIAAALILVEVGAPESALEIAQDLALSTRNIDRAYGQGIVAAHLRRKGQFVEAIDLFRQALDEADLWRLHFELGRTYAEVEMFAEAFLEFQACEQRRGDAVAMYLDDVPTLRYSAEVYYWLGLVHEGLGMPAVALRNFQLFLELRPQGGARAHDAAVRLAQLEEN